MPPRKKAAAKKKTPPPPGGEEELEDSKMEGEEAAMISDAAAANTAAANDGSGAGMNDADANEGGEQQPRQTQLELWEKENEQNLLHLSTTNAPGDELMNASVGHPQHGSELFLGGVPKSASDQDVESLFKGSGKGRGKSNKCPSQPVEIQVVKDPNDSMRNRGYAFCLLYTSPSPRDLSTSRMPSSA